MNFVKKSSLIFTLVFTLGVLAHVSPLLAQTKKVQKPLTTSDFVLSLVKKVQATHTEIAAKAKKAPAITKQVPAKTVTQKTATTNKNTPVATSPKAPTLTISLTPPSVLPLEAQNTAVRGALVNILCTSQAGGPLRPISGSGVIIDPRGIILTNAHIAQYFLLKDYQVRDFLTCSIRTGSPATEAYRAELLYIPPAWVNTNAHHLNEEIPQGTGEHDYALLAITRSFSGAPLPASFPSLLPNIALNSIPDNHPVLLAGYPSEYLGGVITTRDLYALSSPSTLVQGYYFESGSPAQVDLFSVGTTLLAQAGASGGAVVSRIDGSLLGTFVTTTAGTSTNAKTLHAISIAHIDRSMRSQTGRSLLEFLTGDIPEKIVSFNKNLYGTLRETLIRAIERR